jgi:hypothetical protein
LPGDFAFLEKIIFNHRGTEDTEFFNKTLPGTFAPPEQRRLLLQLVDLLESPKEEGDKKLQELELENRQF